MNSLINIQWFENLIDKLQCVMNIMAHKIWIKYNVVLAECWVILVKYVFESVFGSNLILFNKLGLALLVVAKSCSCVKNNIIHNQQMC